MYESIRSEPQYNIRNSIVWCLKCGESNTKYSRLYPIPNITYIKILEFSADREPDIVISDFPPNFKRRDILLKTSEYVFLCYLCLALNMNEIGIVL